MRGKLPRIDITEYYISTKEKYIRKFTREQLQNLKHYYENNRLEKEWKINPLMDKFNTLLKPQGTGEKFRWK